MGILEQNKIADMVIAKLLDKGYVVVKATELDGMERKKREAALMRKKAVTPHAIIKNELIPGIKSPKTIKNMALDGRLGKNEFYRDTNGKLLVLTSAVKRVRGYE